MTMKMQIIPLFMCRTFAIFFIVESIFDSVFSSSFPKSSSILKRISNSVKQLYFMLVANRSYLLTQLVHRVQY